MMLIAPTRRSEFTQNSHSAATHPGYSPRKWHPSVTPCCLLCVYNSTTGAKHTKHLPSTNQGHAGTTMTQWSISAGQGRQIGIFKSLRGDIYSMLKAANNPPLSTHLFKNCWSVTVRWTGMWEWGSNRLLIQQAQALQLSRGCHTAPSRRKLRHRKQQVWNGIPKEKKMEVLNFKTFPFKSHNWLFHIDKHKGLLQYLNEYSLQWRQFWRP